MASRSNQHSNPRLRAQCTRTAADPAPPSWLREALAVLLVCSGVMTLLALFSYHATDLSLNTAAAASRRGAFEVRNWIGPAGAYWADLLLQSLGLGAYPLGAGLILAGWRAFAGRSILPGLREAFGTLLLVVAVATLAHLFWLGTHWPYPPGGLPGVLLGQWLKQGLAVTGATIVAVALGLVALALTADGILWGLGWHGVGLLQGSWRGILGAIRCVKDLLARARSPNGNAEPRRVRLPPLPPPTRARRRGRKDEAVGTTVDAAASDDSEPTIEPEVITAARLSDTRPGADSDDTQADTEAPPSQSVARRKSTVPSRLRRPVHAAHSSVEAVPDVDGSGAANESHGNPFADSATVDNSEDDELAASAADASADRETHDAALPARRRTKASEPQIVDVRPDLRPDFDPKALEGNSREPAVQSPSPTFELPPVSLLDYEAAVREPVDPQKLRDNALKLTKTLKDYGIDGHVREIRPGPVVTMYEYVPGPGIKLSKIASLADDLAMSMEALRVRIVAPIPGKGAVGIEIPNDTRETVYLKEIIAHDTFRKPKSRLTMALGKDIEGAAYVADLARMPHLLVAGATGAGKSVSINAMIMSVLFKATPDEVRMIMVDPKMLELSVYEGIPHLLLPVVTDPKKAALALRWAVEEMERRYELLSEVGVRSIDGYNTKVRLSEERGQKVVLPPKRDGDSETVCDPLPYILVIVDELADLMMVASREVESSIMRLAQMARAAGIHLILATQRPSVDVLTGVIKANFPTRIAFQVASRHDSRTIIDANGAEHLLGRGDMLYLSPGAGGLLRVHGAYVSDEEITRAVDFMRKQGTPQYDESILAPREDAESEGAPEEDMRDEMYDQAVAVVAETRQASISMIQRRLRIGYNRAARMVERMENEGIVGPADGAKPRDVYIASL